MYIQNRSEIPKRVGGGQKVGGGNKWVEIII